MSDRQGKAVQIIHVFGDHLWEAGERLQPPKKEYSKLATFTAEEEQTNNQENTSDEVTSKIAPIDDDDVKDGDIETTISHMSIAESPNADSQTSSSCQDLTSEVESSAVTTDYPTNANTSVEEDVSTAEESENVLEKMNSLLHNCFFTALKVKLKDKELPIPTGTFYRQGACCVLVIEDS